MQIHIKIIKSQKTSVIVLLFRDEKGRGDREDQSFQRKASERLLGTDHPYQAKIAGNHWETHLQVRHDIEWFVMIMFS